MIRFSFVIAGPAQRSIRPVVSCLRSPLIHRRLSSSVSPSSVPSSPHVRLYQYKICPFCNRTKAFLGFSKTKYESTEVNPLTKKEIQWSKDYRKVPIAKIDDQPYFGSDAIVDGLLQDTAVQDRVSARLQTSSLDLESFALGQSAQEWRAFAVDDLAPLLYPNMCRTLGDAYRAFGYINHYHEQFSALQRLGIRSIGSLAMYMAASRVKKKRNISDERQALDEALSHLEQGLAAAGGSSFLSATTAPHLGDVAVYGTLRAIEGLPAHNQAVYDRGGRIRDWYEQMKVEVNY